jgi:acetyl-CoA carboxylase carboxyl transferase subunit alpha
VANGFNLNFEKPIVELERQIESLRETATARDLDVHGEIAPLEEKLTTLRREIYSDLTPMQRVQVARHPRRPYTLDYIERVFTDFVELKGDRLFRDDPAIVGGWARLAGDPVMVIGHQKGRDTKQNLQRKRSSTPPVLTPGWAPRSGARRRPSRGTWKRWRPSRSPSSPP